MCNQGRHSVRWTYRTVVTTVSSVGRDDHQGGSAAVDIDLDRLRADGDDLAVPVHHISWAGNVTGAVLGVEDAAGGCSSTRRSAAFGTIPSGRAVVPPSVVT